MRRSALAALLLASLAATSAEPAWSGGEISLGDACSLLVAAGYPTTLDPLLDPARRADLPLVAGGYWSAVLAIGEAFDCMPAPPEDFQRFRQRRSVARGVPVELEGGPVLLISRGDARPRFRAHGTLLVEVLDAGIAVHRSGAARGTESATAAVLLRLRLAPDVATAEIGEASIDFHRIVGGAAQALHWPHDDPDRESSHELPVRDVSQRRPDPLAVILPAVDQQLASIHLAGTVRYDLLRHASFERLIHPGHRAPVTLETDGPAVDLWLYAAEQAAASPWQRSGLGLGFPPGVELGARPELRVSGLGESPLRAFGQRTVTGAALIHYTSLQQVGTGPYRVEVELSLLERRAELPLELTLHLP
jgi:hypothetical protein